MRELFFFETVDARQILNKSHSHTIRDIEDKEILKEIKEGLLYTLSNLSKEQAEVLYFIYYNDMTEAELSKTHECSVSNISRISRNGLKKLKLKISHASGTLEIFGLKNVDKYSLGIIEALEHESEPIYKKVL